MLPYETVTVVRTSSQTSALYDPAERRLYFAGVLDALRGDVVTVRGMTRRVVEVPQVWLTAGTVLQLEDAPPFLPDLGTLYRTTAGGFDPVTKTYLEPGRTQIWTGPCSVKAESTIGSEVEAARQKVTVQPFSVTVPLDLVDVRPDDVFVVVSVRDPRLSSRDLVVTRVEGGSEELGRVVRVADDQG